MARKGAESIPEREMPMPNEARTSLHVYNARCALTVEPSRNRRGDVHTINLETAARTGTSGEFSWGDKIVVQVTGQELSDVLAVLLGHLDRVEFRYHGASRDKGYRLFHDDGRVIVQLFAGSRDRHTVTLARGDRLAVAVAAFRQLQRNHGGLAADVLHAMHGAIYATRPADDADRRPREGASEAARASSAETPATGDGAETSARSATQESDAYDW
mgnify:CR=1 FL=1